MRKGEFEEMCDMVRDVGQRQRAQVAVLGRDRIAAALQAFALAVDRAAMLARPERCAFAVPAG